MKKSITISNYNITVSTNAKCNFLTKPRLYAFKHLSGYWHFVWWKLSIIIENWALEQHAVCSQCNSSNIGEKSVGDEGWTVCSDCGSIEQGYKFVNLIEYERLS